MSQDGEYWRPCRSSKNHSRSGRRRSARRSKRASSPARSPVTGTRRALFPFGRSVITIALSASTPRRAQAAGFGRAQSGAEDQPEDDRDGVLAERAAVLGADGVSGPEEGGQLLIGEHVRQAAGRAGDPRGRHEEPLRAGQPEVLAELAD